MVTLYIWEIPEKTLVLFIVSLALLLCPRLDLKHWCVGMKCHHILLLFHVPIADTFTLKSLESVKGTTQSWSNGDGGKDDRRLPGGSGI